MEGFYSKLSSVLIHSLKSDWGGDVMCSIWKKTDCEVGQKDVSNGSL